MKRIMLLFSMGILGLQTQAQTILNGSFENHPQDANCSWWNASRWDSEMSNSTVISGFEVWAPSQNCSQLCYHELGDPKDGDWYIFPGSIDSFIVLGVDTTPYFKETAFSLKLSIPLIENDWYKLSFHQRSPVPKMLIQAVFIIAGKIT